MTDYKALINGELVESESGRRLPVYDPSTDEVIAEVPNCNERDVHRAVPAARSAFETWARATAQEQGRVLFHLADYVRMNRDRLVELESRNCGKPTVEAEYDVNPTATCFEYYGGLATKITGSVDPVPDNALSLSLTEPVGVAGQIIPWNFPLLMDAWKLAPALAVGCTCVLKPAEQTPLTILELASHFGEAGFFAMLIIQRASLARNFSAQCVLSYRSIQNRMPFTSPMFLLTDLLLRFGLAISSR